MTSTLNAGEKMVAVSDESPVRARGVRQLPGRWQRLLPAYAQLGRELIARYSEPHRRYHDVRHLAAVLTAVDDLADEADDIDAVRLAAWFHDAVYEIRADDNEERSARLAEAELPRAGVPAPRVADVARLVRLTATHAPPPGDRDAAVLCDADLAVLGSTHVEYAAYAAAVRDEYAEIADADFRAGRAAILTALLALPRLYTTDTGRDRWEARARRNVSREIAGLTS
jgi:predicted metal-dependent HD superfamily phosphohydrolase